MLGKFYAMIVDATSSRGFINWVATGLRSGNDAERQVVRQAVRKAMGLPEFAGQQIGLGAVNLQR